LPAPLPSARKLRASAIEIIKRWIEKFGDGYSKLRVCSDALKRKVNFDSLTLVHDIDEINRNKERERMEVIWRGRLMQVEKEVLDNQDTIDQTIAETRNCINLWVEGGSCDLQDPRTIAVCDQYNILFKRLIPLSKKWTVTLTKAGRFTNHNLFRKCVELKTAIDSMFSEVVGLNINFQEYNDNRVVVVADEKNHLKGPREAELFSDPTTWAASVIKLKDKVHIPDTVSAKALNLNFLAEKQQPSELKPHQKMVLPDLNDINPSADKACAEDS